MVDIFVATGR